MRPNNTFQIEVATAVTGKRSLTMKVGLLLLVALPLIFIEMPSGVRIAGLLMLLVFAGFFGTAVNTLRRRTDGRLERLRLLPMPRWQMWGDLLLADALFVLVRMALVMALFLTVHGKGISPVVLLRAGGLLLLTILVLNALGMLLGLAMRNNQEAHLVGTLAAGAIAFLSGLLPATRLVRDWVQGFASWNPLALLRGSLEGATGAGGSGPEGGATALAVFLAAAIMVFLLRALDLGPGPGKKSCGTS